MRATRKLVPQDGGRRITTDIVGLMTLCGCGDTTARKIAKAAGATIKIGRRSLYSVEKVEKYLQSVAGVTDAGDEKN